MSQFGMQMPGGRMRRGATPDVYTGLMALAVVALLAACAMVYMQGAKVGKDGSAIGLQEPDRIALKQ
ncbi:MAG: hypothetical protein IT431_11595 [Phycisphaerales bacterium]|jgi:hypothetical protein|nr:hypothetical protein [Phycisphaerales bacterium]